MKKLLPLLLIVLTAANTFGQDEEKLKGFRFGLKGGGSLNWYKPDNTKKYESDGVVPKFHYGLMTEFRLTNVVVISTGLQIDYDGGKLQFLDTTGYFYNNKDQVIVEPKDTAGKQLDILLLRERKYNVNYVTVPFSFKMRTKEIGMLTYFGSFGLNTSFKTRARATDKVTNISRGNSQEELSDLEVKQDIQFAKLALNIGAGVEYNLSGTTSLVFGLNYLNGFTNVLKGDSKQLINSSGTAIKQKATGNGIALSVGILF